MIKDSALVTAQKAPAASGKTQKIDSKPNQATSGSNQPRVSSAVQVISCSIYSESFEY